MFVEDGKSERDENCGGIEVKLKDRNSRAKLVAGWTRAVRSALSKIGFQDDTRLAADASWCWLQHSDGAKCHPVDGESAGFAFGPEGGGPEAKGPLSWRLLSEGLIRVPNAVPELADAVKDPTAVLHPGVSGWNGQPAARQAVGSSRVLPGLAGDFGRRPVSREPDPPGSWTTLGYVEKVRPVPHSASLPRAAYSPGEPADASRPVMATDFSFGLRISDRQVGLFILRKARLSPKLWTPWIPYGSRNSNVSSRL